MHHVSADVGAAAAGVRPVSLNAPLRQRRRVVLGYLGLTACLLLASGAGAWADIAGDPRDQPVVSVAINQALELERSGVDIPWSNAQSGRKGTIVLDPATYPQPDNPCRSYRRSIEQAGFTTAEIRGHGCRVGPALWTVEETIATPAKAVESALPPRAAATSTPPPTAKAAPTKATGTSKAAADPPPSRSSPSLPVYTVPSRAGS